MVSIPGGTFLMGSPETDKDRFESESPQHQVTIKPFFMGKYSGLQTRLGTAFSRLLCSGSINAARTLLPRCTSSECNPLYTMTYAHRGDRSPRCPPW
ncbi:formylglycine-generating enzyme family protein [Microseira sp. BLCC-F43]|uniref:formylglycine-generating enzyme family protein n=1 Tax=Microseira sp. BLCC-F43 TaxID=3153602 RepID=UPI0035B77E70